MLNNINTLIQGLALCMSLLGFLLMYVDKSSAKKRLRRIPESNFFMISLLGGGLGICLGGLLFSHKTSKFSFMFKILLGIMLNIGVIYLVLNI